MTALAVSPDRSPTASRSANCHCPELPEVAEPLDGPLTCRCCGRELVLTCPGECGEAHVRESLNHARQQLRAMTPALRVQRPRGPERRRGTITARVYQQKPCVGCGQLFTPTGPRQVRCIACKRGEVGAERGQASRVA